MKKQARDVVVYVRIGPIAKAGLAEYGQRRRFSQARSADDLIELGAHAYAMLSGQITRAEFLARCSTTLGVSAPRPDEMTADEYGTLPMPLDD
jgi:hypothetical protein